MRNAKSACETSNKVVLELGARLLVVPGEVVVASLSRKQRAKLLLNHRPSRATATGVAGLVT